MLVHGPLSLVMMLSVLRSQLKKDEFIKSFQYKNLTPLYVNEPLKICVRCTEDPHLNSETDMRSFDVWIEGKDGLSVKGAAVTTDFER